jgi:hypothetical protein
MKRLATLAVCLSVIPASLRAQSLAPPLPLIPLPQEQPVSQGEAPAPRPAPTTEPTLPGTVVPYRQFSPALYPPLTPSPTVQALTIDDHGHVASAGCPPRIGLASFHPLQRLKSQHCDNGCATSRPFWERFKAWYCYDPNYQRAMPLLRPEPYHAPLYTYVAYDCRNPKFTVAPPPPACGPKGCAAGTADQAPPIKTRLVALVDRFRTGGTGTKETSDPTPAPALRYAKPAATPTAAPAAGNPDVTPTSASTAQQWPGTAGTKPQAPPVTRPFTNP